MISRNLEFYIDDASGKTVITVRDTATKEVIRQIPSEDMLAISARLNKLNDSFTVGNTPAGILFSSQT